MTQYALAECHEKISEEQSVFQVTGDFWGILASNQTVLAVSREYEDFVVLLGGRRGLPWQSVISIPHPSGMFWNFSKRELVVASTKNLNQLFFFRMLHQQDFSSEILPAETILPHGDLLIPRRSVILPGSLYIHDIAMIKDSLFATMTGHNFLGRVLVEGGWERVWWPKLLDEGEFGFRQNHFQLNSIAVGDTVDSSFFTAFSDSTLGAKPWKSGFGPREKGVVFSGRSRDVIVRGLTCPHSARLIGDRLWLCNSGYGETGFIDLGDMNKKLDYQSVCASLGFTRGLTRVGDHYVAVGLSKVIPKYEPYAPGLDPEKTKCGVVLLDRQTGEMAASLVWPGGYQIYDVQSISNAVAPSFSHSIDGNPGNSAYRYFG